MTELTIDRVLIPPPHRVWQAFTTSELAEWFWPPAWQTTATVDLRLGGRYHIASDVSGLALTGEYLAVVPPHRLEMSWCWDGDDEQTAVTIILDLTDSGGTALHLVHRGFSSVDDRQNHVQGWIDCLERLPEHLAR